MYLCSGLYFCVIVYRRPVYQSKTVFLCIGMNCVYVVRVVCISVSLCIVTLCIKIVRVTVYRYENSMFPCSVLCFCVIMYRRSVYWYDSCIRVVCVTV